jgi:anthranilate/para-aminobenzoate synthase component I
VEHIMLLDLSNASARSAIRFVAVDEMMVVRTSHVIHIVSNVRGKLASGGRIRPGARGVSRGTITGVPSGAWRS